MKILRAIPFVGMAVFVLGALPVNAQVNVSSERSGTCVSADEQHRTECFFPSNNGYYSNVQAIGLTEGSGADVTWHYFEAIAATAGIDVGAVFTLNGTSYLPSGESSCVIGFSQYNQNPRCQNPYRGANGLVRIEVRPHNNSWQSDFKLIPD